MTTQSPHMDRTELEAILGLTEDAVRIKPTAVGGGFGSKLDLSVQPYLALAAWKLGRPVRLTYTRPESMMSTTKRHPSRLRVRIGATRDGRLTAMDFTGEFNTGAYASWGSTVANRVPVHAGGPYVYDAYRARTVAIHTNAPPAGAFRGFGCRSRRSRRSACSTSSLTRLGSTGSSSGCGTLSLRACRR